MTFTDGLRKIIDGLTGGFGAMEDPGDDIGAVIENLYDDYGEYTDGSAVMVKEPEHNKSFNEKVKQMPVSRPSDHQIVIIEPRSYGEVRQIVSQLRERKTVMLNLHLLDKEQSQRTIDFICGAVNALDGTPKQVGDTTFVFAPHNVALSNETLSNTNKYVNENWGTKQF